MDVSTQMINEWPTATLDRRFAIREKQRETLIDLGQNKMCENCELEDTPFYRDMVNQITHLFKIIEERGFAS